MPKDKTPTFPAVEDHDDELLWHRFIGAQAFDFYKPHAPVMLDGFEPSMTRQEFAEDCDINTIMARYETTGNFHAPFAKEAHYADYTAAPGSLMEAMEIMRSGEAAFMQLPAKVRREFDNDPMQFVEFASDPANLDQMREWQLAEPAPVEPPPVAPQPVIIVNPDDSATGGKSS